MIRRAGRLRLWVHVVLTVAILAGLVLASMKYLHGNEMAAALRAFDWRYAVPILICSALHIVLKGWWFGIAVNTLAPHVSIGRAMVAYISGQPATLLPGGITARAALLAEAGVPVSISSVPILFSSLLDMFSFTLLTLVAALWFAEARRPALLVLAIVLGLALALAIPPVRRGLDRLLGGLLRRVGWGQHWEHFTTSLAQAASWRFLGTGVLITAVSSFVVAPVLAWCLAAIGHPARFTAILLALGLPTLIGRVTPSPAGAGPFDAGVVGLLGRYAGIGVSEAAAALAIFRVATVLLHALLGVIVFLTLWRPQRVNAADAPAVAVSDQLA